MNIKTYLQDWLEDYGYKLGYNNDDRKPELEDMDWIVKDRFKARYYFDLNLRIAHMDFLRLTGRIQ